jgi:hypothetical protein
MRAVRLSSKSPRGRGRPRSSAFLAAFVVSAVVASGVPATAQDELDVPEPENTSVEVTPTAEVPEPEVTSEPTEEAPDVVESPATPKPSPTAQATKKPAPTSDGLLRRALLSLLAVTDPVVNVELRQKTGTGPFTPGDSSAGNDPSDSDDIIRTNDTITYTVSVRYEGTDHTNPTIEFTLPRGQELVSVPPFCRTGSQVTPTSLPAPTVPVTPTSWQDLPTQTVSCIVGNQDVGTSLDYDFIAKVRSEVPHGTRMDDMSASAVTDQVPTPDVSGTVSQVVSAAARFDISKRLGATTDITGGLEANWGRCSFDNSRTCRLVDFPLTLNTPTGGKGITPLASPITLKDDLRPDSFYGAGTTTSQAWQDAGSNALDMYGARLSTCNSGVLNLGAYLPAPRISSGNPSTHAVRDNGTITCVNTAPGELVDIEITDADTTGYTVPTRSQAGSALAANTGYVVATAIRVEIPVDAIRDLGTDVNGTKTLTFTNRFIDIEADDIHGSPVQGEDLSNNVRTSTATFGASGTFAKVFSAATGAPGNKPTGTGGFSSWQFEGPPGSGTLRDGNTVVIAGQTIMSNITSTEVIPPGTGTTLSRSKMFCDVWDDTKLGMLQTFNYSSRTWSRMQRASEGAPAWISSFYFGSTWDVVGDLDDLANLKIQYSYTPAYGNGVNSTCASGIWYDNPEDVPGAAVVDGVWQGLNRVRVSFSTKAAAAGTAFDVNATIAMRVLASAGPTGTILPNWASQRVASGVQTLDELLANAGASTTSSSYVPASHTGSPGDRLILGEAIARIKKFVRNGSSGTFSDTAVPQYTSGTNVDYRLNPTLTADVSAGTFSQVTVEDCLPRYQAFVSSQRESGAGLNPVVVSDGAPDGAEILCPAGQTYLKWDLGQNEVNEPIDPIVYTVEILDTVRNGNYINTAAVATPGDPTALSVRSDTAQIQIVTPTGVKISKRVDKPVIEVNPQDVLAPRTVKWTIDFANIDASQDVSDVDVIDVLPADGVYGSEFEGTLRLDSVQVVDGDDIEIWYTAGAPSQLRADPDDASNQAAGSTVWCSAASGGSVMRGAGTVADCPAGLAQVTGLRFNRPGDFAPDDALTVDVLMTPVNNAGGDVYENRTAGRAQGVTQPVGPAIRTSRVIESSIGNYVWEDLNSDGIQGEDEPGVAGFPVLLTGEDLDGNPVSLSTTTDADGLYSFTGLASGSYRVTFDPNGLNSNTTFTVRDAGSDDETDSDGDVATGRTVEFELAPESQDPTWDQGLIIDRNVDITVDKRVVDQSELSANNSLTTTYEITVKNAGTAQGVYDLADTLKYGENIVVDGATVQSVDPDGIVVNPDFDGIDDTTVVTGQTINGGASHVYEVVVDSTLEVNVTSRQRDCLLTRSEEGTGYLNEARVSVDETTYVDQACISADPPNIEDEDVDGDDPGGDVSDEGDGLLPNTGGPGLWILLSGILAIIAGFFALLRSRRPTSYAPRH